MLRSFSQMSRKLRILLCAGALFEAAYGCPLFAESSHDAWLRYAPIGETAREKYASLPAAVVVLGDSAALGTAQGELIRGVRGMLGKTLRPEKVLPRGKAIVLGTFESLQAVVPSFRLHSPLNEEGFWLTTGQVHGFPCLIVTAMTDRGVMYGVFALLTKIASHADIASLDEVQQPYARLRWVDQWDNLDGGIERGYGGRSIFFEDGKVRTDLTRVREYARLLASIGINGCSINNVNANPRLLEDVFLPQLARIADAFREWGIRIAISIDLSSPKVIGGLDTLIHWTHVSSNGGAREWTRSTGGFRTSADSLSRRIPKAGPARPPTAGRRRTPPM
jgi:alpha-glucuronidase